MQQHTGGSRKRLDRAHALTLPDLGAAANVPRLGYLAPMSTAHAWRIAPLAALALALELGVVAAPGATVGCTPKTEVAMFVDGFQPKNVRFEIDDKGPLDSAAIDVLAKQPDIDGALRLPPGSCAGPCRVAVVSVFVHNMDPDAQPEPPPVIRLKSPAGKPVRQPIAFRGDEISKGRIGRIRWVVEMYPEETSLTAILSSSVRLFDMPSTPLPPKAAPAPAKPSP
jgi:hypothetical protein